MRFAGTCVGLLRETNLLAVLRVVNIIFFMSALHNQRLKPSKTMFFALVLRNLSKKSILKCDFCISA